MSMLSAQCDKLRELAGDGSMEWVAGPIRASMLREAADTIWELRNDLQRANDAVRDAEHDESRAWDRVRKAEAENAKLRELVEAMPYCMEGKCLKCPLCSYFEPAVGDVPECKALPMLYALGIYGDDEDKLGVMPF